MTEMERAARAARQFVPEENISAIRAFGNGHINDTYMVEVLERGAVRKLTLQRINHEVFRNPEQLMENVAKVTSWLKKRILEEGGDPKRETLNVVYALDGKSYYKDEDGNYFRVYDYIENTVSYEMVRSPRDFYESAVAFGHFQYMLADFPAAKLYETIPDFHNTKKRFERFCQVVKEDKLGRAAGAAAEIRFVMERAALAEELGNLGLPLRVTHNDTKLNNVLLDPETGKAVCVVDLDTVMPGLAVNDFGDSIRFGASTGAEDETDLSRVECSMELFRVYTEGFLKGCGGRLTAEELAALPLGAKTMTFECGMRFLTDYLEGDVYFKIHREGHNLDRCRTQFKLVGDMEQKWEEMCRIVEECARGAEKQP